MLCQTTYSPTALFIPFSATIHQPELRGCSPHKSTISSVPLHHTRPSYKMSQYAPPLLKKSTCFRFLFKMPRLQNQALPNACRTRSAGGVPPLPFELQEREERAEIELITVYPQHRAASPARATFGISGSISAEKIAKLVDVISENIDGRLVACSRDGTSKHGAPLPEALAPKAMRTL